jgi:hypothetical protein
MYDTAWAGHVIHIIPYHPHSSFSEKSITLPSVYHQNNLCLLTFPGYQFSSLTITIFRKTSVQIEKKDSNPELPPYNNVWLMSVKEMENSSELYWKIREIDEVLHGNME